MQAKPAHHKAPPATPSLAELAHGPEAFRLLVEAVLDYAIFLIGPEGHVLTWNVGAERIKGYSADEIIGRHFSVFYPPEDVRAGLPDRILAATARDGGYEGEGWRVRKDGLRFWADVSLTALHDERGRIYGFAKVTRDMTDARAAAERDRQLAIEREARIAAEEAIRARDRFLSIASHELKTPVASLQIAVESLLRSRDQGVLDGPRVERGLVRIDRAVQRLGSLLGELLDVTSLERGATAFNIAEVDIARVAADVIDRFAGVEPADRIHAWLEPTVIKADPARIEQVITNLLDNALKYSASPDPVLVRASPTEGGAQVEISDKGIGLPPDRQRWLFEAFARGGNAAYVPGLGLGLFISREIVDRHGGRISAESGGPGMGATFRVTLPAEPPRTDDGAA